MISLPAATLRAAVDAVMPACERNATLPILQHLLAVVQGTNLLLTATDLERQITTTADLDLTSGPGFSDSEEPAGATLPGHKLQSIARALPGDSTVTLSQTPSGQISLRADRSRYSLGTLAGADYPRLDDADNPMGDANQCVLFQPRLFAAVLKRLIPAMGKGDVRYYLNGLYLARDNHSLDLVATDGHRLHHQRLTATDDTLRIGPDALASPIILPGETVAALAKLADPKNDDDSIRLHASARTAAFSLGATSVHTKLIDGRYPDWTRVVPTQLHHRLAFPRDALISALQEVSVISEDANKGVRCTFLPDAVALESTNASQETATTSVSATTICDTLRTAGTDTTPGVSIGFNVKYLLDALHATTTEQITLRITDSDTSAIVNPADDDSLTLVVMPMRL